MRRGRGWDGLRIFWGIGELGYLLHKDRAHFGVNIGLDV